MLAAVSTVKAGKVWLVGAGPGDPGLITVRGRELLGAADVVLHDALSHPALLDYCSPQAELRDVGRSSFTAASSRKHHFVDLNVFADRIEGRAVDVNGQVFDTFRIPLGSATQGAAN